MPRGAGLMRVGKTFHVRAFALLAALALVSAGCGSRLSDQERAQAISALTGAGSGGGGTGVGTGTETTGGGEAASTGGDTGASPAGGGGSAGGGGGGGGGSASGGAAGGGGGAASCPRATKPSGTGVTANEIKIATLADISGVQPGLFQSAHQAARAATAYINSQGGICGRQIDLMPLDSKTDAGGNRAAMQEACARAFAVVGSMSAFDDGSAAPGESCGIPDMTAITTNAKKYNSKNTFPTFPNAPDKTGTSPPRYIAKRYPNVIKKAAILYLNQAVTRNNALQRVEAWESAGFKFEMNRQVEVLEANYTRFVQEMEDKGIQYVTMVSDYQNIVRLQKTMKQQGYVPKVRDWDSVAYDPDYLAERDPVEGSFVFINTAMFEDASSIPEMKLYLDWLERAAPGATPDYFGLYAWSSFRLFQKLATQIGPDITRPKLLAALKATKQWNGNGVHGPHQIGTKIPSTCNVYMQVKGAKFSRMHPASGFDCSGPLFRG